MFRCCREIDPPRLALGIDDDHLGAEPTQDEPGPVNTVQLVTESHHGLARELGGDMPRTDERRDQGRLLKIYVDHLRNGDSRHAQAVEHIQLPEKHAGAPGIAPANVGAHAIREDLDHGRIVALDTPEAHRGRLEL